MSLYFNRATNQIWSGDLGEGLDTQMDLEGGRLAETSEVNPPIPEDHSDNDINAAALIVGTVSLPIDYQWP